MFVKPSNCIVQVNIVRSGRSNTPRVLCFVFPRALPWYMTYEMRKSHAGLTNVPHDRGFIERSPRPWSGLLINYLAHGALCHVAPFGLNPPPLSPPHLLSSFTLRSKYFPCERRDVSLPRKTKVHVLPTTVVCESFSFSIPSDTHFDDMSILPSGG